MQEGFIPKFAYESEVSIKSSGEEVNTKDINNFFVFKAPFTKSANFATITVPIDVDIYQIIDDDIRKNNFPMLDIKINLAENNFNLKKNARTFSTRSGGIQNQYIIVHCQAREAPEVANNVIPVTFYMMNRILYELTRSKSYNKVFENKNAMSILEDYENHINEKFGGGNLFKFQKYLGDENKFTYKQSLIKTESDILIPAWIVNNMKPSNGLTYYFFDDFIPLPNCGIINGILMTLSKNNVKKLELIDISDSEYQDIELRLQLLKTESVSDISNIFNIENATLNISSPKHKYTVRKSKAVSVATAKQSTVKNDKIMDGRSIENRQYQTNISTGRLNSHGISIYACDSVENGEKRFNSIADLIKKDIEYIATYEAREIHFDAVQLFKAYRLVPEVKDYIYVPISIANIFTKYTKRETTLYHSAKFQFLVYKV